MDYAKIAEDIKARILDGTATVEDQLLAQEIAREARDVWDRHAWLRALAGAGQVDAWMINYLKGEIAIE